MEGSILKSYSLGIAAENKPLKTRILHVVPIEDLDAIDGELNFNPEEHTVTGTDSDGNTYEVSTILDTTYTCEWLPFGSNRVTPPDVRRGEPIEIFRLGDTDKYYWRPLGIRDDLRRLETAIWMFNANPEETEDNGLNVDNCYFIEISTHTKKITIGTSKANGEPFIYQAQINAEEGKITITDDIANYIELISAERWFRIENADNSWIEINKDNIHAQNRTGSLVDIEGDRIVFQNMTMSFGEIEGDRITLQNITGSLFNIEGDEILARNMTGSFARIAGDSIRGENSTGAFVDITGANINIDASSSVNIKSGGTTMNFTPGGTTLTTPSFAGRRG